MFQFHSFIEQGVLPYWFSNIKDWFKDWVLPENQFYCISIYNWLVMLSHHWWEVFCIPHPKCIHRHTLSFKNVSGNEMFDTVVARPKTGRKMMELGESQFAWYNLHIWMDSLPFSFHQPFLDPVLVSKSICSVSAFPLGSLVPPGCPESGLLASTSAFFGQFCGKSWIVAYGIYGNASTSGQGLDSRPIILIWAPHPIGGAGGIYHSPDSASELSIINIKLPRFSFYGFMPFLSLLWYILCLLNMMMVL